MRVLSIVSNRYATFYEKQTKVLEELGIHIDHVHPRKQSPIFEVRSQYSRSYLDYLTVVPRIWRKAFSKYDLVHANNSKTIPFAVCQPHRPIVLTLWGSDLMENYPHLSRWGARYSDEVIVMTQEMADILDRECHIIPHGVDLEQFEPMDQAIARDYLGWDGTKHHVLFPYDTSRTVKNYPLAERVVQRVDAQIDTPVTLQTVADADHEEMPLYMSAADALLLTSKREGSPNSVKEAMACNLPVVATDVGDVAERLSGVTHSYVCASEDELVERLIDVLEAGEGSDGRKHVKELSLERMGERIIEVYEQALSG